MTKKKLHSVKNKKLSYFEGVFIDLTLNSQLSDGLTDQLTNTLTTDIIHTIQHATV